MTLRVVLVDDDERFRALASRALAADGVDIVAEIANGEEAVGTVARWQPDVVLVDIRLPGIDGLEVARRLQVAEGGSAVILISTCDAASGRRMATGLAAGYLPKEELSLAGILGIIGGAG
jgi:CheY-like chemotaxis protein